VTDSWKKAFSPQFAAYIDREYDAVFGTVEIVHLSPTTPYFAQVGDDGTLIEVQSLAYDPSRYPHFIELEPR
jgi:hypothetical protein